MKCNLDVTNDCPHRYVCIATTSDPSEGFCICNRYFGFYGPGCRKLSAASYVLAGFQSVALVAVAFAAYQIFLTGRHLPRRKLFFPAVVRTLVLGSCALLPNAAMMVGALVFLFGGDMSDVFYRFIFWPAQVLWMSFLILTILSLALMWLEVISTLVPQVHPEIDTSSGSVDAAVDIEPTLQRVSYYRYSVYGAAIIFTGGAVGIIMKTHSSAYFTLLSFLFIVLVGIFFLVTGNDLVGRLKYISDKVDRDSPKITAAAASSLKLTRSVFTHHMFIAAFMVVIVFTVPTRTPIYSCQNSLPRVLQGQIPVSLVQIFTSLLIAKVSVYLRTSEGKRVSPVAASYPSFPSSTERIPLDVETCHPVNIAPLKVNNKDDRRRAQGVSKKKRQPKKFELNLQKVPEQSEVGEAGSEL